AGRPALLPGRLQLAARRRAARALGGADAADAGGAALPAAAPAGARLPLAVGVPDRGGGRLRRRRLRLGRRVRDARRPADRCGGVRALSRRRLLPGPALELHLADRRFPALRLPAAPRVHDRLPVLTAARRAHRPPGSTPTAYGKWNPPWESSRTPAPEMRTTAPGEPSTTQPSPVA